MTPPDPDVRPRTVSLSGLSRVAGVIGAPVRQSLSPVLHNGWLAARGIDGVYAPFGVHPERFESFVAGLRGGDVSGVNVTLPFKTRALALADIVDEAAKAAGAANLLLFRRDGAVEARNTDGIGLIEAFHEQAPEVDLEGADVVVLGAGGAARGALGPLLDSGAKNIWVLNRTEQRASTLAARFGPRVRSSSLREARVAFAASQILINATAAGLEGADGLDLPLDRLAPGSVVMDMVYKPLETQLLRQARRLGLRTIDGLAMLIGQARPSFEALFDCPAPRSGAAREWALAHLAAP